MSNTTESPARNDRFTNQTNQSIDNAVDAVIEQERAEWMAANKKAINARFQALVSTNGDKLTAITDAARNMGRELRDTVTDQFDESYDFASFLPGRIYSDVMKSLERQAEREIWNETHHSEALEAE